MKYTIKKICEHGDLQEIAANWFHSKWGVPMEAYLESMEQCIKGKDAVPQWYIAMDNGKIVGGLGQECMYISKRKC